MSYIRSKDVTVYYEEHGSGEPLVLLPGLMGSVESQWRRFIPEFAQHFHVVAPDLRGHGKTNNPSRTLRLDLLIDDLHALLDSLGLDGVGICGYDFGGYVGLAHGLRHPGSTLGLILHATRISWSREGIESFLKEASLEMSPANAPDGGWQELQAEARDLLLSLELEGITPTSLQRATFPVLVSSCEGDEHFPRDDAGMLSSSVPHVQRSIIKGGSHALQTVPKGPLIESSLAFFADCRARRAAQHGKEDP